MKHPFEGETPIFFLWQCQNKTFQQLETFFFLLGQKVSQNQTFIVKKFGFDKSAFSNEKTFCQKIPDQLYS